MATGIFSSYGSSMFIGAMNSMFSGAVSGSSNKSGSLSGMMGGLTGGGGSSNKVPLNSGFMSMLSSNNYLSSFSGGGSATGSSGSLLSNSSGSYGNQFGSLTQSVFSNSSRIGDVQYNSKMTELRNYNTVQHGVYNRAVSYKEAELVNQDAQMRLVELRRQMYRKAHSLGGHKGVRLDSGSIADVNDDLVKQAEYDAKLIKYQAEVNSGRYIDQGNMSTWTAHSTAVMNKNATDNANSKTSSAVGGSLLNSGMSTLGSVFKK